MLDFQLGDWRRVVFVLRLRPPQDQPGGPARGQGAVRRCCHDRQKITWSPLPGCQSLGVAQTLRIAGDRGITPGIAPLLELAKQSQGVTTTCVPALEEIGGVGRKQTAAAVRTTLARRQGRRPEVAKHRILANPQLLGNSPSGPPLLVEGPDLLMERQPPC